MARRLLFKTESGYWRISPVYRETKLISHSFRAVLAAEHSFVLCGCETRFFLVERTQVGGVRKQDAYRDILGGR